MTPRAALRLAAMLGWLLVCLPCYGIARLFGGGAVWVRRFLRGIGWILGLRVRIEGRPIDGPALYVANHITFLDILALGGVVPARFVAKAEIADWALVGFLAKVGGTIFVSRERRGETRVQADRVAAALAGPRPIVLFGEGATGDGIALMPFRAPLFVSAIEAGAPVQPVAIDYGPARAHHAWSDDVSFATEAKRLLNSRARVPVTLRFLARIDPSLRDRKALAAASRGAIAEALDAADRAVTARP